VNTSALALDYDGTIARGDALDPAVREAIAAARTAGLTVLLVTGRILEIEAPCQQVPARAGL
jgi:hydroxymethylpyrimidine pyrophosphatase-like HAD family hydrolase